MTELVLTKEEREFILNLLNQATVKLTDPNSVVATQLSRSILEKLKE